MSEFPYQSVAIVGAGLIGGSVGLALRERKLARRTVALARSEESARRVLRAGVVDEATTSAGEGLLDADVVVVATPVGRVAESVLAALRLAPAGALVTDAGSTKATIVAAVESGLAAIAREAYPAFVAAHPLAGDHRTGPEAARAGLFQGAVTILTPTAATPEAAVERARTFWSSLGCRVEVMTPAAHDACLALTSHVPHVAAAAVAATTPLEALAMAATGWADTTRIAAGSPELWRDILLANRGPVAEGLRSLGDLLRAYAVALDAADGPTLERLLEEGRRRRDALGS
ncbi:MAG: prephenate dehydrogenase [Lacipirellulaceae bacterium]